VSRAGPDAGIYCAHIPRHDRARGRDGAEGGRHADAKAIVDHLMSEQMFSGWGIRTMAEGMGRYNPVGCPRRSPAIRGR
jgi:hypothetical protein